MTHPALASYGLMKDVVIPVLLVTIEEGSFMGPDIDALPLNSVDERAPVRNRQPNRG